MNPLQNTAPMLSQYNLLAELPSKTMQIFKSILPILFTPEVDNLASVQRSGEIVRDFKTQAIDILLATNAAESQNQIIESKLELANLLEEFEAFSEFEKLIARLNNAALNYAVKAHQCKITDVTLQQQIALGNIQLEINNAYELLKETPRLVSTVLKGLFEKVSLIEQGLPPDPSSQKLVKGGPFIFFMQKCGFSPPATSLKKSISEALSGPS